jgi:hypothetical protein
MTVAATERPLNGQASPVREGSCRTCRIVVKDSVVLGDEDGPGIVGNIFTIARLSTGQYALSYDANDAVILVFDSAGRFQREVGRRGSGPGEYQFIRFLRAEGPRLHVYDGRLRRETVLSDRFDVLRSAVFATNLSGDALPLDERRSVLNGTFATPDKAGLYLHVLEERALTRSFDDHNASAYRYDLSHIYRRALGQSASGGFWSAYRTEYRIDRWSGSGSREASFTRVADWFRPHLTSGRASGSTGPQPTIRAVREDEAGRLWVLIAVADARWERAVVSTPEGQTFSDPNDYYDSIVEVLDPQRREVLATLRLGPSLTEMPRAGEAAYYHEDSRGIPRIVVLKLAFQP